MNALERIAVRVLVLIVIACGLAECTGREYLW